MNINNIKLAASAVAAVAVTGVTIQSVRIHRQKKAMTDIESKIESFYSPEFIAFNKAQDIVSDRMLAGYYDDKPDSDARDDYIVLYVNFLKK
ncbi:MAG: hypothetical protein WBP33_08375 [Saprospiraceae bacterium]